jgi:hypothetical protein
LERWSRRADTGSVNGYYEGLASGAAVLMSFGADDKKEKAVTQLVAACQQAYETNGVVFACMLARIMLLSQVTFQLQTLTSKKLYGTEDLRILEYPWQNATSAELVARMEQDVSLAGNAFEAKVEDDELWRLPPAEVTIISEEVTSSLTGAVYKRPIGYDWDPSLSNPNTGGFDRPAFHGRRGGALVADPRPFGQLSGHVVAVADLARGLRRQRNAQLQDDVPGSRPARPNRQVRGEAATCDCRRCRRKADGQIWRG